eukprot:1698266-Amphidinium_carterae.1
MSSVLDVTDDGDDFQVSPQTIADTSDADQKGGLPMEDYEPKPTPEQRLEPYADFSLFTPFGHRAAKTLRLRSWIPQGDGAYKPADIPCSPSLILRLLAGASRRDTRRLKFEDGTCVVRPQTQEIYFERFRHVVEEHGETWHRGCQAEDRC